MLTLKQRQTFDFINRYILQQSIAPTEAEIALGIGIHSRGVVHRHLCALVKAGLIVLLPGRRRNIQIIDQLPGAMHLPVIGKIAAGIPIEAIHAPQFLELNRLFLGPGRFILEVKGDSMADDNICEGDYIICERCETANNGAIVIALIDSQEATLKRLKRNVDNTVTLLPSNPNYPPIIYPAHRVQIQGVYLGLLRLGVSRR